MRNNLKYIRPLCVDEQVASPLVAQAAHGGHHGGARLPARGAKHVTEQRRDVVSMAGLSV